VFHFWVPEQHIRRVFKESPNSSGRTVDKNAIYKLHDGMPIPSFSLFLLSFSLHNESVEKVSGKSNH
jgi:hypothetical protein